MISKLKINKGFTLVEILVAVALFTVIASFSTGAVLSIFDANNRARASKTVVDNLNLAIEDMVRTVRFGNNFHCGNSGNLASPTNCPDSSGSDLLDVTFKGDVIVYRLNGTAIQKSSDGGSNYTDITSPETSIDYLRFYVFNSQSSDNKQPYVVAVIKGHSGNKITAQSSFSIETTISQRVLDFNI